MSSFRLQPTPSSSTTVEQPVPSLQGICRECSRTTCKQQRMRRLDRGIDSAGVVVALRRQLARNNDDVEHALVPSDGEGDRGTDSLAHQ